MSANTSHTLLDISRPITPDTPVYESDPAPELARTSHLRADDPDSWNASVLTVGTHTATHVDPPAHFCPDGATVDQLDLSQLCGPARVVDLRGHRSIDISHLTALHLDRTERLLLHTDGSAMWSGGFRRDYPHITAQAARWLRANTSVRLVGIDTWSIEGWDSPSFPVHRTLLCGAPPILVLEGLDLDGIQPGIYELMVLPLLVNDADGGLARAVLAPKPGKR